MRTLTILIAFGTLLVSCKRADQCINLEFSEEQRKNPNEHIKRRKTVEDLNGKIVLYFEEGFSNTVISIENDNGYAITDTLNTDDIISFANAFEVNPKPNRPLKITINDVCYYLMLKDEYSLYYFNMKDTELEKIEYNNHFPSYD